MRLDCILQDVTHNDKIILFGDINAIVERDYIVWKEIIHKPGIGKINENVLQLLRLRTTHNFTIIKS